MGRLVDIVRSATRFNIRFNPRPTLWIKSVRLAYCHNNQWSLLMSFHIYFFSSDSKIGTSSTKRKKNHCLRWNNVKVNDVECNQSNSNCVLPSRDTNGVFTFLLFSKIFDSQCHRCMVRNIFESTRGKRTQHGTNGKISRHNENGDIDCVGVFGVQRVQHIFFFLFIFYS